VFRSGPNITMKVPRERFQEALGYCQRSLGLERIESLAPAIVFALGENRLWVDAVEKLNEMEVWLEFQTDSSATAAALLGRTDVVRRESIEPLPRGFEGLWIKTRADFLGLSV
jgi:hypothetical protein